MNYKFSTLIIFLIFFIKSYGQINPIQNLTWDAYYEFPNNYFILEWDEPELPHDELIGYNVYREDELYRFQIETSLYNLPEGSNCDELFLLFNEGESFYAHVTAVYNPGEVESDYTETVFIEGLALGTDDFNKQQLIFYPNPTSGLLHIVNNSFNKIQVFNLIGNQLKEFNSDTQIDLSSLTKGIYIIKLISDKGTLVDKVILK